MMSTSSLSIDIANEADVSHVIINLSLGISQTSKGINDDTKDNVEEQDNNNQEERQIEYSSDKVLLFGVVEV